MASMNVSKWQAARQRPYYHPVQQFYLRMIRTALDEAKAVKGVDCPYAGGWYPDGIPMMVGFDPGISVTRALALMESWDSAIMARAWIARETPDRHADREGFLLSFEHACEVLGLNSDYEATWMLREIDECADFDTEEVHARVEWLNANPPDDVDEPMFEAFRVVPVLDQGSLFGEAA